MKLPCVFFIVAVAQPVAAVLGTKHAGGKEGPEVVQGSALGRLKAGSGGGLLETKALAVPVVRDLSASESAPQSLSDSATLSSWTDVKPVFEGLMTMRLVGSDVFSDKRTLVPASTLISSAPKSEWLVLLTTSFIVLCFDVIVLQSFKSSRSMNFRILAFWFAVAAGYNTYYWLRYGQEEGLDWCTGYLLEWLLSADNLFVFHMVFKVYNTPEPLMHKALFVGIAGAILFKMIFFLTLGSLMHALDWIRFVFGAILIYSGIMAVWEDEEGEEDLSGLYSVRAVKFMMGSRLLSDYDIDGKQLFVLRDGKTHATLLVLVICVLEITDVLFAVDSVSAKVAQIDNQYTAYSSSVLAIFGLRAMFFVLHDLVDCFELLKVGLCIILIFIGMQLMLAKWVQLASSTVCMVIVSVMMACILGSFAKKPQQEIIDKI
eukprot:CAMPEP_0170591164 /NCGR_PEP_ID=MMETSP0224-20130122/12258_1 /TAXON_ID=285029 /ORGANISM="Togula jolla, Strain CCCM 725" /LENGTH=430 /DNA_ID=CAMNT_0010915011 /DNA_START=42 /DNA_END=1334 /DNA_ORIENTATION=-